MSFERLKKEVEEMVEAAKAAAAKSADQKAKHEETQTQLTEAKAEIERLKTATAGAIDPAEFDALAEKLDGAQATLGQAEAAREEVQQTIENAPAPDVDAAAADPAAPAAPADPNAPTS